MVRPWPHVTSEDRAAVAAALEGDDLSPARKQQSEALEEEWARYVGVRYCVATNSARPRSTWRWPASVWSRATR